MNPEQGRLVDLPIGNVLAIAPAGCGKTEALAARAGAVVNRGEVVAPRTILALTFSNKARDNLATRMKSVVGAGWRQRILVTNFHGLAGRVIRAHGGVAGLPDDIVFPEEPWLRQARSDLGITYKNGGSFDEVLRLAKAGPYDDETVMDRLKESGHEAAIAYEERLRAEGRLDYDDLLRHAARVLALPGVGRLYQAHFGMVMVDEVQDLSLMQFEMVRAVGGDTVTYAGDPAQGIYSFAGADPGAVFERIGQFDPIVVEFNQSYRSAPAVLRAVSALAVEVGSTGLVCAHPERWPDDGHVISLERESREDEAASLLKLTQELTVDPTLTIGIVGRRGTRAKDFREAANRVDLAFEDWSVATHVPVVVQLLNRCVDEAVKGANSEEEALGRLGDLCQGAIDSADVETLNELAGAFEVLQRLVVDGMSVRDAVGTCRISTAPDAPVAAGVHMLTGHKGKGQEFDWVIVVGLEDGHIPDFRSGTAETHAEELRVLHVMVSRARYGVVVTFARKDGWRTANPSPWLEVLRAAATKLDHA